MKKKLLVFSSFGLLIIISAIVFLRISQRNTQPIPEVDLRPIEQDINPQGSGQISPEKAREIAGGIISWLNTMRNDLGRYYVSESCENNVCSKGPITDKQIGINVVWARYRNYLNGKKQQELEELKKDLITLTTPEIGFPAQNDFLNCKLMHEMSTSGVFTNESKNKIDKICQGSVHYGSEMQEFINNGTNLYRNEPPVKEVMAGEALMIWEIASPEKFIKYAIYASDIGHYYLWVNNSDDLAAAKYYFNMALQIFSSKKDSLDDGVLALSALDLNKVTHEGQYLDFADYLFNNKKNEDCRSLTDCAYYLMFLEEYKEETGNDEVKEEIKSTIAYLMDHSFDGKKDLFRNLSGQTYPSLENAIIVGSLANLSL